MSIFQLINEIENGEIVLPAIQRDFVWDEDKIQLLFDSLLRGYPVGIALLWETYQPIQYRKFERHYRPDELHKFLDNEEGRRLNLVLDGQQRLNSLYVALKGTFDSKRLYFDVLSGRDSDDHSEEKYHFWFAAYEEAKKENDDAQRTATRSSGGDVPGGADQAYWLLVSDIIGRHPVDLLRLRDQVATTLSLTSDDKLRMELNFQALTYALSENEEVLKTQTIDNKLPATDQKRKSAFDILEIFVRVNTQGVRLSRSDLIVSMLRLYWQNASDLLPNFVKEINDGNSLGMDNDFVIRCMFSVAGIGTRLDFELLRKKTNVEKIKNTYSQCFDAIRAASDFARVDCGIDNARLLGGINTLVPFVHYLFHAPMHRFGTSKANARKALFIFALSKTFTQHYESRTAAFIRDYLPDEKEIGTGAAFPYETVIEYVYQKTNLTALDHRLFASNIELTLALAQGRTGGKIHYADNMPEIDHIFPRSVLAEKGVDAQDINDIGNLWILPRGMNRNKSAKHPKQFLENTEDEVLKMARIERELLDYRSFIKFIRGRRDALTHRVEEVTRIKPQDFKTIQEEAAAE